MGLEGAQEENGGSLALFTPLPTLTVPNSPPLTEARPAGWAGGGEVGGKRCGALRQWGRQAKLLDSPRKVAKSQLRFSPGANPRFFTAVCLLVAPKLAGPRIFLEVEADREPRS